MSVDSWASVRKLIGLDALVATASGQRGVPVSLQCHHSLEGLTRSGRLRNLKAAFEDIAQSIRGQGADVNLDSVSVSGQTVEAVLPVDRFDEIVKSLDEQDIRVDVLIDRKAT